MIIEKKDIKKFNKIKLRKVNVLNCNFLWKCGHLHLKEFKSSKCVEKVIIYLEGYENSPLILYFKEDDNELINSEKNEKWNIGYPDQGIIWQEKNEESLINLHNSLTIIKIIEFYFKVKWNPNGSSTTSFINEIALIDIINFKI